MHRTTITFSDELWEKLRRHAFERGQPINRVVNEWIEFLLADHRIASHPRTPPTDERSEP